MFGFQNSYNFILEIKDYRAMIIFCQNSIRMYSLWEQCLCLVHWLSVPRNAWHMPGLNEYALTNQFHVLFICKIHPQCDCQFRYPALLPVQKSIRHFPHGICICRVTQTLYVAAASSFQWCTRSIPVAETFRANVSPSPPQDQVI